MIRLAALNDDTSKSSEEYDVHPKEPSEEVQEENALKLYSEALQEQKNGKFEKAEGLYKQLLTSSLLMKVRPDEESTKSNKTDICSMYLNPSYMLKYSCLKNLAVISQKKAMLNVALDYYNQALEVEGTDVTMWYQSGCIAMKLGNITMALDAFLKGLELSSKHWPSIDKLIICLFILNDYVNCLYFISQAFELDVNYTRGQVLRDYILAEQSSLLSDIKYFFPKINLHVNVQCRAEHIKEKLIKEVFDIKNDYYKKAKLQVCVEEDIKSFIPDKIFMSPTWVNLGEIILHAHEKITNNEKHIGLLTPVDLKKAFEKIEPNFEDNQKVCSSTVESAEYVNNGNNCKEISHKEKSESDKKNKKNRGSALMEELLWGGKRRSARVRSSLRGNPEPMDVAEALRRILPRKLLHKTKHLKLEGSAKVSSALDEDSMDTMDLYRLFEKQESAEEKRQKEELERTEAEHDIDKIVETEGYFGTKDETQDVVFFIESHSGQSIIELLKLFVLTLKTHWKKTWPNFLPNIYIKCYQLMRRYHPLDFKICTTESNFKNLVKESGCILLYGELFLEYSTVNRNKNESKVDTNLPIIFLQNVMELTDRRDMFTNDEEYFEFLVRLYWLRCRIFLGKGQTNLAIVSLNDVLACYELHPQFLTHVVHLKNCKKHNIISKTITEDFLAYQSRKRSLAEVVRLYEDECYQELTDILKETFTTTPDTVSSSFKEHESEVVDRQTQLSMLVNGLYHLSEYKECIYWLETCCYEVLQKSSIESYNKESWMVVFDRFLVAIEDCLKLGKTTIIETLPSNRVSRFVQTLCHAICKELEDSDRPPCPARPWIMLNTILIELETLGKSETSPDEESEEDENDIPSSVLILFTAHEYLGRREWCNCNDSVLLFLIMDQVIPHIRNSDWSTFRETVQQHLEQAVYCLYAHPSKKTKARYLTDHNVNSIQLTWLRGVQLFDLFKPDETPAYDSLRINLINSDTEALFRKIAALIPDEKDPVQMSDKMTDFIVGKRNDVPISNVKLPEAAQDLFYILGDYYFKTHEFAKAVNYLLMDLCANPSRVDSWASMALSKASILEQQLNSCNPIKDNEFLQDALSALRCYEHCLQLDNKQCTLWIEYGSFVYTIHSFCSQRMKQESDSLSMEQFEELESTKNKMLDTAKQAFVNANLIWEEMKDENERQDERWLHHYMLGKVSEKNGDLNYFDHYDKAAELLYENEAEFPNKVGYTAPQTLAIEALEIYYRVHVCVIKNLELNEGKPLDSKTRQVFSKHLNLCAKGAFAKQISKEDLAKMKAKEIETTQHEKNMKIIKGILNDLITKIEMEAENVESSTTAELNTEKNIKGFDSPIKLESLDPLMDTKGIMEKTENQIYIEEVKLENSQMFTDKKGAEIFDKDFSGLVEANNKFQKEQIAAPLPFDIVDYKQFNDISSDNYYVGLEDLKNGPQTSSKPKKKQKLSQGSVSSSSGKSDEIRYDDDSSSSSSSSDSSGSSQSSSSSSSETSQSEETNKDQLKVSDEEDKQNEKNSEKDSESGEKSDVDDSESLMLKKCLSAFETCALRFPQHYKSVYRLAHFYFRSKEHRDISKCRELLLGRYQTPNGNISGLFADWKSTNFFNGIWRIPAGDVDRPGSFASHMSRSVLLLMEVLRDLKDHKMLLEICLQLRKTPEPDKKYLREDERNQLSLQACDLTIQTLRKNVKDSVVMTLPMVLDCYRCYQKVQKYYPLKEPLYGDILLEAFKGLGKGDKCSLEQAIRFCQSEISASKIKTPKNPNANQFGTPKPKPTKVKKQDRKKSTPKPQITAKAVPKTPKPKKACENKKKVSMNILKQNIPSDAVSYASVLKSTEPKQDPAKPVSSVQMYAELLRNAALTAKQKEQMDKKIADQMAFKHMLDQLKTGIGQKLVADQSKPATTFFPYQNSPLDFTTDMYKQLLNKFWFNNPLNSELFSHLQNLKKNKAKVSKPRSVLKPKLQKPEPSTPEENKPKTNFNIENILGKPTISSSGTLNLSKTIEDKIKSIASEVNVTKFSPPQAINLSTNRKDVPESGKRPFPEPSESNNVKKVCRELETLKDKKNDIEVVVIDD